MTDPPIISLDIETYGNCRVTNSNKPLPSQNFFHPERSLLCDKPPLSSLILTASVTLPLKDPRPPREPEWSPEALAALEPGDTFVFQFSNPSHLRCLARWIDHADTIIGMNLLFDIPFMRRLSQFRSRLAGRHTLIDLAIVNYLHNEARPERSLKDLGAVLGTHSYDNVSCEYNRPDDPAHIHYNAEDTHNTLVAVATLARHIHADYPGSAKLSPYCVSFYSNVLWSSIRMLEAGTPISSSKAHNLEDQLTTAIKEKSLLLKEKHGITAKGPGSDKSKRTYLEALCAYINTTPLAEDALGCPLFESALFSLTPKKKEISFAKTNRIVLRKILPSTHPAQEALALWLEVETASKLISSYLKPFLHGRTSGAKHPESTLFLKHHTCKNPDTILGFSRIYIVPSPFKDSQGGDGGQIQSRLSFADPSVPTFPSAIKKLEQSRYKNGIIFGADLSQIELRVAALLSGEPSLLEPFRDGTDLHTQRAEQVYEIPNLISKYGPLYANDPGFQELERQCGKHGNFTDLNWGGSGVLQRTILTKGDTLVPLSFCQKIVATRPTTRPILFDYQVRLVEEAHQNEIVTLPFIGQSRHFRGGIRFNDPRRRNESSYVPLRGEHKPNDVVNLPIQALAACVMLEIIHETTKALPPLSAYSPPCHAFACVYDSIFFDTEPHLFSPLKEAFTTAVHKVATTGLWAKLIDKYGHELPLTFDFTVLSGDPT